MPTLVVTLTSNEEAALIVRARSEGTSLDSFLRKVIMRTISTPVEDDPKPVELTAEEFDGAMDEAADMVSTGLALRDEALGRETNYTREDEWNL